MINDFKSYLKPLLFVLKAGICHTLFLVYLAGLTEEERCFSVNRIAQKTSIKADKLYKFLKNPINWSTLFYTLSKMLTLNKDWYFIVDGSPLKLPFSQYRTTKKGLVSIKGMKNVPHNELITLLLSNGKFCIVVDFRIWCSPKVCKASDYRTKNQYAFDMIRKLENKKIPVKKILFDSGFYNKALIEYLNRKKYLWTTRLKKNTLIWKGKEKVRVDTLNIKRDVKYLLKLAGTDQKVMITKLIVNKKEIYMITNDEQKEPSEISKERKLRWKIEVFHRDAKQQLGLDDYQYETFESIKNHVGFCCLLYSLLSLSRKSETSSIGSTKQKLKANVHQITCILDIYVQKFIA